MNNDQLSPVQAIPDSRLMEEDVQDQIFSPVWTMALDNLLENEPEATRTLWAEGPEKFLDLLAQTVQNLLAAVPPGQYNQDKEVQLLEKLAVLANRQADVVGEDPKADAEPLNDQLKNRIRVWNSKLQDRVSNLLETTDSTPTT